MPTETKQEFKELPSELHSLTNNEKSYVQLSTSNICNSQTPAIFLDYYSALIDTENFNTEYLKFLTKLGLNCKLGLGKIVGWQPLRCTHHGRILFYPMAVTGELNPFHCWKSIRSSVSRTVRKLEVVKEIRNLTDWSFTYPNEVAKKMLRNSEIIESKTHECMKLLYDYLEKLFGGKLAMSENFHPHSTAEPLKPHPHNHVLIPDMYLVKVGTLEIRKSIKLPISKKLLAEIKIEWGNIIAKVFKLPQYKNGSKKVDVYLKWLPKMVKMDNEWMLNPRVVHKLKYSKRKPLVDLAEWFKTNPLKKLVNKKFALYCLEFRNETHTYGYWRKIKLYANLKPSPNILRCPICSYPMERLECIEKYPENNPPPDIIIQDRSGEFRVFGLRHVAKGIEKYV